MKKLFSLLLFVAALSVLPARAATYYVDNCVTVGSDSNNGTSTSTPWLTAAHARTHTFSPGDSLLFRSSCTWYEIVYVEQSGTSGNPITIGSYGTGAPPIFNGGVTPTWTNYAGNVWVATVSATPNQLFKNNVLATKAASEGALTEGQWYATGTTLYYYESAGNPGSQGYTLVASVISGLIFSFSQNYLIIENLQALYSNTSGADIYSNSSNVTMTGMTAAYSYTFGFYVEGTGGPTESNNSITDSTAFDNGESGIEVGDYTATTLLANNTIYGNGTQNIAFSGGIRTCSTGMTTSGLTITENYIYQNGAQDYSDTGMGIWLDCQSTGTVISYNQIWGNSAIGIFIEITSGVKVYGNVVFGNNEGLQIDAHDSTAASNNLVYNNTIYGNTVGGAYVVGDESASNIVSNNLIENNLILGNGSYSISTCGGGNNDGTYGSGNVYDYNGLGVASTNFMVWACTTNYSTYATWEAASGNCGTTGCSHSMESDPAFTNQSIDNLTLTATSLAICAGVVLGGIYNQVLLPTSSWPLNVVTGPQTTCGATIGAYVPSAIPNNPAPVKLGLLLAGKR
jgi:parallel beta-helix repeat protein